MKRAASTPSPSSTTTTLDDDDDDSSDPDSSTMYFTFARPPSPKKDQVPETKPIYLPFWPFAPPPSSPKSNELGAEDLKDDDEPAQSAKEAESRARRVRVTEALNDDSAKVKDVKYFVDKNLEQYLEKRGYLQRPENEKVISKGVFASLLRREDAISNCVSFGPQYEADEIIGEIEMFWKFYLSLKTTNIIMSVELKPTLIPMLIYFYLECFVSGYTSVALRIYIEFSKRFLAEDATQESADILLRLAAITSPEVFDDNELLQAFRNQERRFTLSLATFKLLKKHVLNTPCPIMRHLFSNRFTIQMRDTACILEKFVELPCPDSPEPPKSQKRTESRAANVIKRLRENVSADLPALSLHLISGRPICGAISSLGSMIAFGFRDGHGIQLDHIKSNNGNEKFDSEEVDPSKTGQDAQKNLIGHVGSVFDVSFHPLSKRLFSVGQDSTMKVWDLRSGQCKAVYRGHAFPIGVLDIAESGRLLATGSIDATVRIWEPERTNYVRLLAGHYSTVSAVKFHPNEAYIATGSMDTSARLWSVSNGDMVRVFTGFDGKITALAFHESGKYLLAGGSDAFIRIWDIAQGEVLSDLSCPPNCSSIAIHQNILCAAFESNQVRFWNLLSVLNNASSGQNNANEPHSSPRSKEVECNSNSILKLHFTTPRHVIGLGGKDDDTKRDTAKEKEGRKRKRRVENFEETEDVNARADSREDAPLTGKDKFLEKLLKKLGISEENAFSEVDKKSFSI